MINWLYQLPTHFVSDSLAVTNREKLPPYGGKKKFSSVLASFKIVKDIAGIRKLITCNSSVAAATQSDAWTSLARLPARARLRSSYTRCWPRSPFHPGRAPPTVPSPALPLYGSAENSLLNVKLLMVMVVVAAGLASVMVTVKGGVCSPTLQWHWFSPPLLGHLLQ